MGKYFKKKVNKNSSDVLKKSMLILAGVVVVIIIIILLVKAMGKPKINTPKEELQLKDKIELEVHSDIPEEKDFFEVYKNVEDSTITIDFNDLNTDKVGEYEVFIKNTKKGNTDTVKVFVLDTQPPELTVKDLVIEEDQAYTSTDFVENCKDNDGDCFVEFSNLEKDGAYKEPGTYEIIITAFDNNDNEIAKKVTLTINPKPVKCKFGDKVISDEDKDKPIALYVIDKEECAVDNRNIYDNDTQKLLEEMIANELLKEDLPEKIDAYCKNKKIKCASETYTFKIPIYSNDEKIEEDDRGIIGYAIRIDKYFGETYQEAHKHEEDHLKLSYYVKEDGTRQFIKNEFNIK